MARTPPAIRTRPIWGRMGSYLCAIEFSWESCWRREAGKGVPRGPGHLKNSYDSETAVADGERVYASFGNVGIFAYDMTGKLVWSLPVSRTRTRFGWGTASSPVLYKGRLIVVNDNDDASYLTAIDSRTGKTLWKVARPGEK